mgnify:CR=1 FL=1
MTNQKSKSSIPPNHSLTKHKAEFAEYLYQQYSSHYIKTKICLVGLQNNKAEKSQTMIFAAFISLHMAMYDFESTYSFNSGATTNIFSSSFFKARASGDSFSSTTGSGGAASSFTSCFSPSSPSPGS